MISFRCDNVTQTLEDSSKEQLKNDNVLVKIYFRRLESHLQSFGKKDFPKILNSLGNDQKKYTLEVKARKSDGLL